MANWVNIGTIRTADCKVGSIVSLDGKQYQVQALSADGKSCQLVERKEPLVVDVKPSVVKPNNQPAPGSIGNTTGLITPDTEPNTSGSSSAPPIKPAEKEKGWWARWGSDVVHGALDVAGFFPVLGAIPDVINAGVYAAEGDMVQAGISLVAAVPGAGDAVAAGNIGVKIGTRGAKELAEAAEKKLAKELAEAAEKKVAKEAAEAAEKKAAKEAEEAAAKKKKGGKDKGNCKHLEKGPPGATHQGGKHGKVKGDSQRGVRESHHMPPDSISPHGREGGPAISMDYADHRALSSTGRTTADPFSQAQEKLAKSGPTGFLAAMMTEVVEIRGKFGDKYDPAIAWMFLWAACMGYIPSPGSKK
jgi:hypothetical protein